jgi:hypothetical protein
MHGIQLLMGIPLIIPAGSRTESSKKLPSCLRMVTIMRVSAVLLKNQLLRKAALLFVPAFFFVGANFTENIKITTHTVSFEKASFNWSITASAVEAENEEGENNNRPNSDFICTEPACFKNRAPLTIELISIFQRPQPLSQIAFSLNPRAPPAL